MIFPRVARDLFNPPAGVLVIACLVQIGLKLDYIISSFLLGTVDK